MDPVFNPSLYAKLSVANTWTAGQNFTTGTTTISTADINGGTIDGTAIGGTAAAAVAATTISASGQITSTVATGTAPLVVASTTAVANLNTSLLLGQTWANPGAIGGTTPAAVSCTTLTSTSTTEATTGGAGAITTAGGIYAAKKIISASGIECVALTASGVITTNAGQITIQGTTAPFMTMSDGTRQQSWEASSGFMVFTPPADRWIKFSGGDTPDTLAGGTTRVDCGNGWLKVGNGIVGGGPITGTVLTASDKVVITPATAAATVAGGIQLETNQDKHYAYTNAIGGWLEKCIFSQYAAVTHSGAVTSQSLASATARGTRTLPANFFKQGKVLKYRLCGVYTTDAAAGNATVLIKIGSTTIRTTGSFALDNSVTDGYWVLEGEFTCATTGGSGTLIGQVAWIHAQSTPPNEGPLYEMPMTTTGAVTIDTTASGAFDVEWTADDAGTAITCTCFRLWEVC